MAKFCEGFSEIDRLPEPSLPVKYPRLPGFKPKQEENQLNGWFWKTNIRGAENGKLAGRTVAIKDNIAVASVPMMVGCAAFKGYIPGFDATVVTRVLDAGGVILGKSACESLCRGGSSFTGIGGPIRNYHNPLYSAGGSSGGSATLVASGEVDLAIGGDQGGSIRLPAAWCGVVGLKPTFGLIPYTGAVCIDPSIDHLGPMARNVKDCALLLEVLAGSDNGLDHRQPSNLTVPEYTKELEAPDLFGMKVGLVKEGFETDTADPRVNDIVKTAVKRLESVGVVVEEVSFPLHKVAAHIWSAIGFEGAKDTNLHHFGGGAGHSGFYPSSFMTFAARSMKTAIDQTSLLSKVIFLMGEYLSENYPGQFYGKGQNLRRIVKEEYDEVLKKYDVVAMPTVPFTARKLPLKDITLCDYFHQSFESSANVLPANVTGMPALTVNAGFIDGLPKAEITRIE
ncbi:Glutamyl-tRNA(Gln) amidotransferase subunit A, chloroplastic/mitochondrial [Holothuria leucospilota]|uniref:Glutamyl-tRNA(Gln) amidotransferase subunit A, chloroplastic/mitochondrial n=1 Tax=Holothuria leucospilota TaxID=206669 RepID=A0A9Q0YK41_HOLLE|nr:Glutamyl-tRNA(Gln) amidotransferase subunit A, chloroplastic/mitochondrial [Holothuria leucospilota]